MPAWDVRRAAVRARAALTRYDAASGTHAVLSGWGETDGRDEFTSFPKGRRLVVEAACVGEGMVTVTVSSGGAVAHRLVPCGAVPAMRSLTFTTAATGLVIDHAGGGGVSGGFAYQVRAAM